MRKTIHKTEAKEPSISAIRRLSPTAKLPSPAVLGRLSLEERGLLQKRLSEPFECVYHPSFRRLAVPSPEPRQTERVRQPVKRGSEPTIAVRHSSPEVLTADEERTLFLRFNYCRNRAMRILRKYRGRHLDAVGTRELLRWERLAQETRTDIVGANTSLVLAMARRARNSRVELSELISEGNVALVRCVDKFDAARGFKFSTYACRAILASFSRAGAKSARFRAYFPTNYDPAMERSDYVDSKRETIEMDCVDELKKILCDNSAALSAVERRVLDARFSLGRTSAPRPGERRRTLDQVGNLLGVSKERVRQIQNQAMCKLRAVLEQSLPTAC